MFKSDDIDLEVLTFEENTVTICIKDFDSEKTALHVKNAATHYKYVGKGA